MAVVEGTASVRRSRARRILSDRNGLEVLDEATCFALLGGAALGRVAYIAAGIARVVPVNIAVQDGAVHVRVGTGGLLAAITDGQLLTLEADDHDTDSFGGWSVIVTGPAREIARRPDRSLPMVYSWLQPDAARLVRLTPLEISGRRLQGLLDDRSNDHGERTAQ